MLGIFRNLTDIYRQSHNFEQALKLSDSISPRVIYRETNLNSKVIYSNVIRVINSVEAEGAERSQRRERKREREIAMFALEYLIVPETNRVE